jgi:hypothetical protein
MAQGLIRTGAASATAGLILPARANRRALIFFPPSSGSYTLSDSPNITAAEGIFLSSGNPHVVLDQAVVGDLVKQALYVLGSGSFNFGYIEVLD